MQYTISKGMINDYDDIIDFGNYVFNIDFPALLPKLYKNHSENSQYHHILKEGNKIRAVVGNFPLRLDVCGNSLKVFGIGTVSVHRYARNKGYMKLLMDKAMDEMSEEGFDMAVLGGQRQRYEYWGFTPCGTTINVNFNRSNLKHDNFDEEKYDFRLYGENSSDDLSRAFELHESQPVHAYRKKDDFVDICRSWSSKLFFIYNNGHFAGYLCASENYEAVNEIFLTEPQKILHVIISYMKHFNLNNTSVTLYMHRPDEFLKLSRTCEGYSINSCCNIYVNNYKKVIKAFMDLKNTYSPLRDGSLILDISGKGRYKIEAAGGAVSVKETEEPTDISLTQFEAAALLFSHGSFINTEYDRISPVVREWFPLPMFFPHNDNV